MAYWVELSKPCDVTGCPRRATVQVFNAMNAPQGRYCKIHGRIRLNDLRSSEAVAHAKASRER